MTATDPSRCEHCGGDRDRATGCYAIVSEGFGLGNDRLLAFCGRACRAGWREGRPAGVTAGWQARLSQFGIGRGLSQPNELEG